MSIHILGFNCYLDDSSACLLRDGRVIAVVQEERFSRKTHDGAFPIKAIQKCLEIGGIALEDIDHVAFNMSPLTDFHHRLFSVARGLPGSLRFGSSHGGRWFSMLRADHAFRKIVGPGRYRFHFVEHHLTHAASAFYLSPFDKAAVLAIDGAGESKCTLSLRGEGNQLKKLEAMHFPHSLGYLYMAFTQYLGFKANSDEGKVMGLASYGQPEFLEEFRTFARAKPNGRYWLDPTYFSHHNGSAVYYSPSVPKVFGMPPRVPESEIAPFHENLAASLQARLEELCFHVMRRLHERTGLKRLCLAGGVALNCTMNGLIRHNTDFEEIFVQPGANDSGGGLGAALYVYHQVLGHDRAEIMTHALLGPSYDDRDIQDALPSHYSVQTVDPVEKGADLLSSGKYVGWFQGRSEFGPRALGSRSIIADPRVPDMADRLNEKVKFREKFRPFAPSVLEEHADRFFENYTTSPFMLLTFQARRERAAEIPAVVHVDGSARVQGVTREANPLYYSLIKRFGERTGIPLILNTSFNLRGEPIVETPADALKTFEHSGLQDLLIGNFYIRKTQE